MSGRCLAILVGISLAAPTASWTADPANNPQPGEVRTFNEGLGLKLVWCPPGTFLMGSPDSDTSAYRDERPQHRVMLTKGLWLGQTEVTQKQWTALMGTTPWQGSYLIRAGDDYAASYVSWNDAQEFCEKLTVQERQAGRLAADQKYALPTEAQWECACRAGTTTQYSFGDDPKQLGEYAWFGGNAWFHEEDYPHEVAQKKPNPWGLHDIHGNVWEWTADRYGKDYYASSPEADPQGPAEGDGRVFRGGEWRYKAWLCRCANRGWDGPRTRGYYLGFRVAVAPAVESLER